MYTSQNKPIIRSTFHIFTLYTYHHGVSDEQEQVCSLHSKHGSSPVEGIHNQRCLPGARKLPTRYVCATTIHTFCTRGCPATVRGSEWKPHGSYDATTIDGATHAVQHGSIPTPPSTPFHSTRGTIHDAGPELWTHAVRCADGSWARTRRQETKELCCHRNQRQGVEGIACQEREQDIEGCCARSHPEGTHTTSGEDETALRYALVRYLRFGFVVIAIVYLPLFRLRKVCKPAKTSVPRNRVYSHYATRCGTERVVPLNPASFGKLVRVIFPGIQTRRLGVRGESKYHYVDLALCDEDESATSQAPMSTNMNGSQSEYRRSMSAAPSDFAYVLPSLKKSSRGLCTDLTADLVPDTMLILLLSRQRKLAQRLNPHRCQITVDHHLRASSSLTQTAVECNPRMMAH